MANFDDYPGDFILYSNLKNWPQLFYPVDHTIIGLLLIIGFPYTYPLDSDLSGGQRYPTF